MTDSHLTITTEFGPIKGFTDTHPISSTSNYELSTSPSGSFPPVHKFLSIPYAKSNRFQRPTDPTPWKEVRECFAFGTMFPQPSGMTEQLLLKVPGFVTRTTRQSEESHWINVFVPGDYKIGQEEEKLPVMVWVYGGALNTGSSDRYFYDPTSLVRSSMSSASRRCIFVTFNYRINIFGFGSSKDLEDQDREGLSGNYGLYDCVKAFEWVQSNISNFGGDPNRVTAFGQSAGAFLLSYLCVSGKKLFKRAILQSGAQGTMGIRQSHHAYPALPSILRSLSPSNEIPSSASERLELLRSASTSKLLELHTMNHSLESLNLTLEPPSNPTSTWTQSNVERLSRGEIDEWIEGIMIGTTRDEGSVFAYGAKLSNPTNFENWIARFSTSVQQEVRDKYVGVGKNHPEEGSCQLVDLPGSKLLSDQIFVNPVYDFAKAITTTASSEGGKHKKVWMYRLNKGVERIEKFAPFGVSHSGDIPLIFKCSGLWSDDSECDTAKLSDSMSSRWLNFGVDGQPDSEWKPFDPTDPNWLTFNERGQVLNESLKDFERTKIDLVMKPLVSSSSIGKDGEETGGTEKEEGEKGDEVLGTTNEE